MEEEKVYNELNSEFYSISFHRICLSTGPAGTSAAPITDAKGPDMHCPVAAVKVWGQLQGDDGHAVVMEMIIALVKHDNLAGLAGADQIDLLKGRHAMAMREIANRAWFTALKGINNHRDKIHVSVMEVLADARAATDVVANHVAEKVLGTKSMAPFLDMKSARLRPLAQAAQNPLMVHLGDCRVPRTRIPLPLAEWDSNGLGRLRRPLIVSR